MGRERPVHSFRRTVRTAGVLPTLLDSYYQSKGLHGHSNALVSLAFGRHFVTFLNLFVPCIDPLGR